MRFPAALPISTNITAIAARLIVWKDRPMKSINSLILLLCFWMLANVADGQAISEVSSESLLIGRGDLLHITIFREPDLEQKVRVKDSGEIDLDLAGMIQVAGLN